MVLYKSFGVKGVNREVALGLEQRKNATSEK